MPLGFHLFAHTQSLSVPTLILNTMRAHTKYWSRDQLLRVTCLGDENSRTSLRGSQLGCIYSVPFQGLSASSYDLHSNYS